MREDCLELTLFVCIRPVKFRNGEMMLKTEEYLVETADRCIKLAQEGRRLIDRLVTISEELMAKAVELDTTRDKKGKGSQR